MKSSNVPQDGSFIHSFQRMQNLLIIIINSLKEFINLKCYLQTTHLDDLKPYQLYRLNLKFFPVMTEYKSYLSLILQKYCVSFLLFLKAQAHQGGGGTPSHGLKKGFQSNLGLMGGTQWKARIGCLFLASRGLPMTPFFFFFFFVDAKAPTIY